MNLLIILLPTCLPKNTLSIFVPFGGVCDRSIKGLSIFQFNKLSISSSLNSMYVWKGVSLLPPNPYNLKISKLTVFP